MVLPEQSQPSIYQRLPYKEAHLPDQTTPTADTGKLMLLAATNPAIYELLVKYGFRPESWTMDDTKAVQQANEAIAMARSAHRLRQRIREEHAPETALPADADQLSIESLLSTLLHMQAQA